MRCVYEHKRNHESQRDLFFINITHTLNYNKKEIKKGNIRNKSIDKIGIAKNKFNLTEINMTIIQMRVIAEIYKQKCKCQWFERQLRFLLDFILSIKFA